LICLFWCATEASAKQQVSEKTGDPGEQQDQGILKTIIGHGGTSLLAQVKGLLLENQFLENADFDLKEGMPTVASLR